MGLWRHGSTDDKILQVGSSDVDDDRHRVQAFIVHVEKPEHMVFATAEERADWHRSFLPSPTLGSGEPRLMYSYDKAICGFAAWLTAAEVEGMDGIDGFLYAHPAGEGMIIGVFDTGMDPNIPSFNDSGMPPRPGINMLEIKAPFRLARRNRSPSGRSSLVPFPALHRSAPASSTTPPAVAAASFSAGDRCMLFVPFKHRKYHCNNKVIGAMAFDKRSKTPPAVDDFDHHGTLVASCAAGSPLAGASYHGLAAGTAFGAAPRAYIAVDTAKSSADNLAAYDQAIKDGVDVFSVSMGNGQARPFYNDEYAIGALSAVENGIFVSVAAGNKGPGHGTILESAPWTLSVGASSTDRVVSAIIHLGNGTQVHGESLLSPESAARFPTTQLRCLWCSQGRRARSKPTAMIPHWGTSTSRAR
ncbi:hypothetical protein Taro_031554 [Colocasia esculenta]|uniref:Uncharacterized protein n=1 Tax=Colocasia esculenta TaxID=4460 RepID=A0A843VUY7_COLES|nr:hypothetical protein [Colocasia esculenta]